MHSEISICEIKLNYPGKRTLDRGVRYIDEKLSKADKSLFLKLSATYRYRKIKNLKLSKNYRYRKMHQIWSDKYIKRPKYQKLNFSKFLSTKCKKITPSCLVTLKRSTNSILIFLHRQLRYKFMRYFVPF